MDEDGVSPVIGTILVLGILGVVTSTMLTVVWPEIQDTQDRGDFQVVSSQMSKVGADMTNMAMGGNVGEIRQRTVATPGGELGLERGHLWAISVGLKDEDYNNVSDPDAGVERHQHPSFNISDHDGPDGDQVHVVYRDDRYDERDLDWRLHRFTGAEWDECTSCSGSGTVESGASFLVDVSTSGEILRDGPWRVQIEDPDGLIGMVYVYELNRISYQHFGAVKERAVFLENGALFSQEDNVLYSMNQGLYRTATTGGGTSGLNLRAAQLESSDLHTTTGRAKTNIQFSLNVQEHLAHDMGAYHASLQPIDGPLNTSWAKHLAGDAFEAGTTGVAFTWSTPDPDLIKVYPLSVIYSEIKVRMVSN